MHHIRPKLLRPLVFPEKNTLSQINKKVKVYKETRIKFPLYMKESERIGILPMRAMVARYIAVVMFAMKTTA